MYVSITNSMGWILSPRKCTWHIFILNYKRLSRSKRSWNRMFQCTQYCDKPEHRPCSDTTFSDYESVPSAAAGGYQTSEIWAARLRLARKRREMLLNSEEYGKKWDGINKGGSTWWGISKCKGIIMFEGETPPAATVQIQLSTHCHHGKRWELQERTW